jgi:FkbM family methyltransferase
MNAAASTSTVTRLFEGRRIVIEAPTAGVILSAWRKGRWYEEPLLAHLRSLKLRGLAVDAGANVGNHTLWLALVCGLQVAAFEPLHAALLRRNLAANRLVHRVQVYEVALGRAADTAAHLGKGQLATGRGLIAVRTLDSFGLHGVVLLKADVEFMEPDVLRGGEQTIRRDRPIIVAEVHPGHEQALAEVLRPWGYERRRVFHGKGSPTPVEEWRSTQASP